MTTLQQEARALGDPTRHRIFRYLLEADEPVGVAELTDHFGLNHNAIRQHLANLVDAELITERTAPPQGPGRPRLLYEIDPTVEGRWGAASPYQRLSLLLSEVITSDATAVEVGRRAGGQRPIQSGEYDAAVTEIEAIVARDGFEPELDRRPDGVDIVLHRCPFLAAAVAVPEVVCELHLGLAEGMAEGNESITVAELVVRDPRRSPCRLRLDRAPG
jgi:predicted ArsR family transcriptional regulator